MQLNKILYSILKNETPVNHLLSYGENRENQEVGLLESCSGLQLLQNCCLDKRNCYQSSDMSFFSSFYLLLTPSSYKPWKT